MNKFKVGQKVTDSSGEVMEVLAFSYDSDNGFMYKVSAKEVDMAKKEVIEGIRHYREGELKKVK